MKRPLEDRRIRSDLTDDRSGPRFKSRTDKESSSRTLKGKEESTKFSTKDQGQKMRKN